MNVNENERKGNGSKVGKASEPFSLRNDSTAENGFVINFFTVSRRPENNPVDSAARDKAHTHADAGREET
jgi:hypothetical protein